MDPADTALNTATTTLTSCPGTTVGGGIQVISSGGGGAGSGMSMIGVTSSGVAGVSGTSGGQHMMTLLSPTDTGDTQTGSMVTSKEEEEDSSNAASSDCKSPGQRTKSNQRWMKLRTTVQLSSAIQKKPPLKREDSFLKRFSTRQIPETQETMEETGSESASGDHDKSSKRRRRYNQKRRSVVNPDENFYFYWLMVLTVCILYNLWTLIVRQSFPELQEQMPNFWFACDSLTDVIFIMDIIVQLRTGYLEQGLMVYNDKKLALHYMRSRNFSLDLAALIPLDLLQIRLGTQPLLRFPRFLKVYRSVKFYYIVESRTVWPNLWRVVNLIHILLILAHWFGCFYFLLSEVEGFQGDWVYPYRPGDYATLTRKYLGSLYWSTLTLTTIGDLPTPETNAEPSNSADGPRSIPRRGLKSRLLQFASNYGYIFTIVSYLIGVFIFATIVGQVGNVITNRNANRLEFERLLDGAKTYMRHHKVPGGMKRRVLRWYDYSWSRGRIQGGGDINTALGLLPDKLKTELALHVNLSVLKKVTIFQECQPEFLHDLVLKMKAYIFTPGDSICRKGEVAREMFIIADGILEVLSETGKVLTTMKAGDFFGEIGILNLDGLNKRTADVRSVGYSELFSLSREDVLAAMKDYPEAQDILQTLGRKRLMEVRCVNKKHAKNVAERESIANKLKSDVKGIKNVLRKSRWATGRRSNESIDLQPLHHASSLANKTPKGVLRRMPRVRSDEMTAGETDVSGIGAGAAVAATTVSNGEQNHEPIKEKSPSPIGAGLPLLQRLRLLKEKQDREERAVKSAQPAQISPTHHTHARSAVSPQQSIQEEPERELIGAGLPLLQRLKLLKAKEERLAKECHSKIQSVLQSAQHSISASTSVSPMGANTMLSSLKAPTNTSTSVVAGIIPSSSNVKPPLKVSFRDRIRSLQHDHLKSMSSSTPSATPTDKDHKVVDELKQQLVLNVPSSSSSGSTSSKVIKPSTLSIKDKIKQLGHQALVSKADDSMSADQLRPWSKLKLATVVSGGSSYTSLNNSMNEASPPSPPPIKIAKIKPTTSTTTTTASTDKLTVSSATKSSERICKSDSELKNSELIQLRSKFKPRTFKVTGEPKDYRSVDDLSPEYGGLPFVKKLKILNERQKLAQLESVMLKTRSFSLDNPDTTENDLIEPLIRSHSEGSGMIRPKLSNIVTPTNIVPIAPLNIPQCLQSPISPESNETLERRQLKSILKKLSEEKGNAGQQQKREQQQQSAAGNEQDIRGLLHAPTVEGPPTSAHSVTDTKDERSQFPLLSAQPTTSPPPPLSPTSHQMRQQASPSHLQTDTFNIPPPCSPFSQSENSFLLDDSTNRLQADENDEFGAHINKFGDLVSPKAATSPFFPKKFIKGSIEEHEFFGEILFGIKNVIQNHLREVQVKFQDRFQTLELEITHRDLVIRQLQCRIHELEEGVPNSIPSPNGNAARYVGSASGGSTGSSGDIAFVRGDSLDTIFASSPTRENEKPREKVKLKKRSSPRRRQRLEQQESTDQEMTRSELLSMRPKRAVGGSMLIDDATGNITHISDSVVLQIESSTATNSSSGESQMDEDEEQEEELDQEEEEEEAEEEDVFDDEGGEQEGAGELHGDDWEIRMLAAELNRRESKREEPISSETTSEAEEGSSSLVRHRSRKRSDTLDTDTEYSEMEHDQATRPRASSLDQYNLRRQKAKGVIKAKSFDRDKERL